MLETSARLLRLLAVLQSRRDHSGTALARRLEVDVRTVRRDVDKLRSLGYRIDSAAGAGGGYRLGSGSTMPPMLLADDEVIAVGLGLLTTALGGVRGVDDAALRAFTKLEQLVPPRLARRLSAVVSATQPLLTPGAATVDGALLAELATACADRLVVQLDYRSHDGADSKRTVEPLRLVAVQQRWYLVAFDRSRADWRTLRVDRIQRCVVTKDPVTTPPLTDVESFVARSITSAPYRFQAQVRFFAPLAEVAQRVSASAGRLLPESRTTCLFEAGANSLTSIALHVADKGFDFEVLSPPELITETAKLARQLANAAVTSRRPARGAATTRALARAATPRGNTAPSRTTAAAPAPRRR